MFTQRSLFSQNSEGFLDLNNCAICESSALKTSVTRNGYHHRKCLSCGFIFVANPPSENELISIYQVSRGYHIPPNDSDRLGTQILEKIAGASEAKVLDVGCGSGNFLAGLPTTMEKHGCDVSEALIDICKKRNIVAEVGRLQDLNFNSDYFDWVHLGDVIEHVTDPIGLFREVDRVVKPGGHVSIATPNMRSYWAKASISMAKVPGFECSVLTPPYHLSNFSEKAVRNLAGRFGYRRVAFWTYKASFDYEWRGALGFKTKRKLGLKKAVRLAAVWLTFFVVYYSISLLGKLMPRRAHLHSVSVLEKSVSSKKEGALRP